MNQTYMSYDELLNLIAKTEFHQLSETMTVCIITLKSGFDILGKARRDPKKHTQVMAQERAYENALDRLWKYGRFLKLHQNQTADNG